jgi:hypothetical protein
MDARTFDRLARSLTEAGTRRGLLGLLATLPLLGGLLALFRDVDETDAKGRRKRRKKPHKHGKGNGRHRKGKRKCKPLARTTVCAGKCGKVKNNCKKTIDCGSCACTPPCDECFTCQEGPTTPGACVPDPDQQGEPCGSDGQVCQADGECRCSGDSCGACRTCERDGTCAGCTGCCDGGTCVEACGDCQVCDTGQCRGCPDCCDANGVCQEGDTNAACGSSGTCEVCTGQDECQGQSCICIPACGGKVCGPDGCGDDCGPGCAACETCLGDGTCSDPCGGSGCCAGSTCADGESNSACGRNGQACQVCSGTGVTCGGGGTPGVCGCTPITTCPAGVACGTIPDGCGGTVTCGTCGSGQGCLAGVCSPVRFAFVSSVRYTGNLGGLDGADAKCTALAAAAGLPGSYRAWLSDDTGSPATRFTQSPLPYVMVNDTVIANNWAGLTSGTLLRDFEVTETGAGVISAVWTNTNGNGTLTSGGSDCDNWTNGTFTPPSGPVGRCGDTFSTDVGWTLNPGSGIRCDAPESLFCFQQG